MKSNLYLCGMTSAGNEANLREMIEPILDYFDGLIWTFHYPKDEGAEYLEKNKKNGEIIYAKWCNRHGYSQNHFLWQGPMKEGDKFILLDSSERIGKNFMDNILSQLIDKMDKNNIAMIANYGKGLLFRYNEQLEFKGSPHWFATNLDGISWNIELSKEDFWNVRGRNRDKMEWISHYARYMLEYPAGSNHALLGLEKLGDPQKLFPQREGLRVELRRRLTELGVELKVDKFKEYLVNNKDNLDPLVKNCINIDKVWNDCFRYWVLEDKTLIDNHNWSDMIVI